MKKVISIIALALAMTMMMSVAAFAADGFVVDTTVSNVTAKAAGDDINVTIADAVGGAYYGVLLTGEVAEGSYPTDETPIYYINQETAPDGFDVKPIIPEETTAMTLFVSTNAADADLVRIPVSYVVAPANDYITSADTTKGTIAVNVANVSDASMGAARGNAIVALALNAEAYPTAGSIVKAVNADGSVIENSKVYYSTERGKYVALIPTAVTEYKFEVIAAGTEGVVANDVIAKYGNMNEDANGLINITDYAQFAKIYKKTADAASVADAKKALLADVSGDAKVNITDYAQFAKAYKKQSYNFAVLTK